LNKWKETIFHLPVNSFFSFWFFYPAPSANNFFMANVWERSPFLSHTHIILAERERERERRTWEIRVKCPRCYYISPASRRSGEKNKRKGNWRRYVTSYNVGRKAKKKRKMFKVQNW
jgi:hypothetical protein